MKAHNQRNYLFLCLVMLPVLLLPVSSFNGSEINPEQLVKNVERKISGTYDSKFIIASDQKGIVTVKGDVNTLFDKLKISEIISQVKGVTGIKNEIEVQTEGTADKMIKANIENELQLNNTILEPEKIKVEVNNGAVNLSGTVSYFREMLMAQSIASWQDGVIDLKNNIKVLPHLAAVSDDNLKILISDILLKNFPAENEIKFSVGSGIVNLYGVAKNLYAKDHIPQEVQNLLGVKGIINNITMNRFNQI